MAVVQCVGDSCECGEGRRNIVFVKFCRRRVNAYAGAEGDSPRYVIWEEGRQPRNPLGQCESWVNDLWFREERDTKADAVQAAAQAAISAGGRRWGNGLDMRTVHNPAILGRSSNQIQKTRVVDQEQTTGPGSSAGEAIDIDAGDERVERGVPSDWGWQNLPRW